MQSIRVLIVEALAIVATHIEDVMLNHDIPSVICHDPKAALTALGHEPQQLNIVVLGNKLDLQALGNFADQIVNSGAGLIILSTQAERVSEILKGDQIAVLDKPFSDEELLNSVIRLSTCVKQGLARVEP